MVGVVASGYEPWAALPLLRPTAMALKELPNSGTLLPPLPMATTWIYSSRLTTQSNRARILDTSGGVVERPNCGLPPGCWRSGDAATRSEKIRHPISSVVAVDVGNPGSKGGAVAVKVLADGGGVAADG